MASRSSLILLRLVAMMSAGVGSCSSLMSALIVRFRNPNLRISEGEMKVMAVPWLPARPVRPMRWT